MYSMVISNAGPSSANNIFLAHNLPADCTFVSATLSQGTFGVYSGVLNCSLGHMGPGQSATATVKVIPNKSETVSSTAVVGYPGPDYNTANNSVTLSTFVSPPRSDLALTMSDSPDPVLAGGLLTYTVGVVNYGPSAATNVMVTNFLPASVFINNVSVSQGVYVPSGNTILAKMGAIPVGGTATITMTVTPLSIGLIGASAVVTSDQSDPLQGNNSASVTTTVGQAADLSVSITSQPNPVLLSNLLTYTVAVTNFGPGVAQEVSLIQHLPPGLVLKSAVCGANTPITNLTDYVTVNVATIPTNGSAILTVVVQAPAAPATLLSSATVSSLLQDPNGANNSASCSTVVAVPSVDIEPAGTTLVSESLTPTNGVIDVAERVSVKFWLKNSGTITASNITATLLAGGGVSLPAPVSGTNYGIMPPSFSTNQEFAFTAVGGNDVVTASVWVQGVSQLGVISTTNTFTFPLPATTAFFNTNQIVIPSQGTASPYPSTNVVSGITGAVQKVTATLINFTHSYPHDVSVLLVSPSGRKSILMAHGGGDYGSAVTNVSLTFDDSALIAFPNSSKLTTGSYRPAGYSPSVTFSIAGPYETNMTTFAGTNPNGTWSLYVIDDSSGDSGYIMSGWSLAITTIAPGNNVADIALFASCEPNPVIVGSSTRCSFSITNYGPNMASNIGFTNVLPSGLVFDDGKTSFGTNISLLPMGSGQTIIKNVKVNSVGSFTCANSAKASELDLNLLNNSLNLSIQGVMPTANIGVAVRGTTNIISDDDLVYVITVTNAGPNNALNVVLTNILPSGVVLGGSPANWSGAWSTNIIGATNIALRCNLGTVYSGGSATVSWGAKALLAQNLTNTVSVCTDSTDLDSGNNVASIVTCVVVPQPLIIPAGSRMVAENALLNSAVDPGETVTIQFSLANIGLRATTNLIAQIQPNSGILTNGQTSVFGAIAVGMTNSCPVTFKALANPSKAVGVTFALSTMASRWELSLLLSRFLLRLRFPTQVPLASPIWGPPRRILPPST